MFSKGRSDDAIISVTGRDFAEAPWWRRSDVTPLNSCNPAGGEMWFSSVFELFLRCAKLFPAVYAGRTVTL
jgi:hypothetical protein